jgi:hypothetical protein
MRRRKPVKPDLRLVEQTSSDPTSPPPQLGEAGRNLWRSIQSEFRVDDAPGWNTLLQICCAADIAEEAHDRSLLKDELAARSFVTRGLHRLNFDVEKTRDRVGRQLFAASEKHCNGPPNEV